MKLLLDTHAFIWWDRDTAKLPTATLNRLQSPENQVLLSLASLWEIQIKLQLGKLTPRGNLADIVRHQQAEGNITLLPIEFSHILELEQLPQHHRDPFNRLLISQGRVELAAIVTRDAIFESYDCQAVW
ncbi:type II toxin-antitoxin system VapC family toxin [Nodosilinea sp. PGN35]|uniref:type II toxin-antitoxin system VapC family toxin n=1 Tax=Nodosilinea sp. PGN35 TaxID=3020489 RepID=UPI0023B23235|nr:type II toxin-antitoxin system VapC family toxin [Nodosilinea sp. TSF1-S3]MDF0368424.1 type II toxin-antitoxin system VapC family toxin [Nodosilinea sp. TSF1-S3]